MFTKLKEIIKKVRAMFKKNTIEKNMHVDVSISDTMSNAIDKWIAIYENKSPWLNNNVESMGLGAAIASHLAKLVTMEFESEITTDEFLNEEYQVVIDEIRNSVEYACAKGGLVFKPYVSDGHVEVDLVQADSFYPVSFTSRKEVTGAIFLETNTEGDNLYTRLEYHRFENKVYRISNMAFKKKQYGSYTNNDDLGIQIQLSEVPEWESIQPEVEIKDLIKPLFSYFRMPMANNIETSSPLGVSAYSRAIDLIKEADKQYSRILWEYEGSELAVHAAEELFKPQKDKKGNIISSKLPVGKERLYRTLDIDTTESGVSKLIDTFNPDIRDTSLFNGLNKILRLIEFNCGLAYGTLSDLQEVDKTAEEIKSSKQNSYQTVKDIQKALKKALKDLVYAMNSLANLYNLSSNKIDIYNDISFNFDDSIIVDKNSELESMRLDVAAGILKPEIYLMAKYGKTEEEVKEMMPSGEDLTQEDDLENSDKSLEE